MTNKLSLNQIRRIAKKMQFSIGKLRNAEFYVLLDLKRKTTLTAVMTLSETAEYLKTLRRTSISV